MKTYFISDDSYFLIGLETSLRGLHCDKAFINTNRFTTFHPDKNDLLIVSIQDHIKRRNYLSNQKAHGPRVIIIADFLVCHDTQEKYPRIVSKKITKENLIEVLQNVKESDVIKRYASKIEYQIIYMICKGKGMREIAMKYNLSLKYLYGLKRKILKEHGLDNCNVNGLLICRDILSGH
ncbi:hypothetical protein QO152_02935 [Pantoea allii]|uniref:hypothetical protein n=1 Tax=Pantoea allii TaxID=574096 RepID=UPI00397732A0